MMKPSKDGLIIMLNSHSNYLGMIDYEFLSYFSDRYDEKTKTLIKAPLKFSDTYEMTDVQKKLFKHHGKTTIGRFIFNIFCMCKEYVEKFGYIDEPMTSSINEEFHDNLALLLVDKIIDHNVYCDIINRIGWLGGNCAPHSGLSIDYKSITMSKDFLKEKNRVYDNLIKNDADGSEVLKEEDKLLEKAKAEKAGTGMYEIIKSGSKGSFTNNFKVINIGRGITKNGNGELKIIGTDLVNGNGTNEYVQLSNNGIQGTFGRSMKTAQGGYLTKLVSSGYSYLKISDTVEDCKSDEFYTIKLTNKNYKLYLYRNFHLNGKIQELNLNNFKDYLNKELKFRSPMFCRCKDGICSTCFGNLYKRNGIKSGLNVILTDLTSKIMNTSMKSFHDLTVKYYDVDISKYF